MSEPASPCPYCREPMKRAFTIAPSDGQPEMLVLYCAPCKHVKTIAPTSPRPTLNQLRARVTTRVEQAHSSNVSD